MSQENVLDLSWSDVLTTPDDRIVGPTLDKDIAGFIDVPAVPGGEPAGGGPDVVGIFAGDLLTTDVDVPSRPRGAGTTLFITDLDLNARQWQPGRRQARATAGSWLSRARRWSSGPSTAMVELVSVSP